MRLLPLLAFTLLAATGVNAAGIDLSLKNQWQPLFNGRNLDGWTPKINHHALGENYANTFTAADGILHVSQAAYPSFRNEFAHLIYTTPFSHYRLRLQYRFVGTDKAGAPPWSSRNSGVMFHGQAPETMGLDQPFPVAFEMQLLNGDGKEVRATANVCTPGTTLTVHGEPLKTHCYPSTAPTFTGSGWVKLELEVHGSKSVIEKINDQVVLEYGDLKLDATDLRAMELYLARPTPSTDLASGYISLQGEGHPIDFRNIEIMLLPEKD